MVVWRAMCSFTIREVNIKYCNIKKSIKYIFWNLYICKLGQDAGTGHDQTGGGYVPR